MPLTRSDLFALLDAMHEAQANYRKHQYDCVTGKSFEPDISDREAYLDWSLKKQSLLTAMCSAEEAYSAAAREFNKLQFEGQ